MPSLSYPPRSDGLSLWAQRSRTDEYVERQAAIGQSSEVYDKQRLLLVNQQCQHFEKQLEESVRIHRQAVSSRSEHRQPLARQVKSHMYQYQMCMAQHACPSEFQVYTRCWKNSTAMLDPQAMLEMHKSRMTDSICRPERELTERCIGRMVSRAVSADSSGLFGPQHDGETQESNMES